MNEGIVPWNKWRRAHPRIRPDLSGLDFRGVNLFDANLRKIRPARNFPVLVRIIMLSPAKRQRKKQVAEDPIRVNDTLTGRAGIRGRRG